MHANAQVVASVMSDWLEGGGMDFACLSMLRLKPTTFQVRRKQHTKCILFKIGSVSNIKVEIVYTKQ